MKNVSTNFMREGEENCARRRKYSDQNIIDIYRGMKKKEKKEK